MIISHRYRFILACPTKVATQSLHKSLLPMLDRHDLYLYEWPSKEGQLGKHSTLEEVRKIIPADIWATYVKVGFVRNPWDREVSWYEYSKHPSSGKRNTSGMTFEQFVANPPFPYAPLWSYFCDSEGNLLTNVIGRYERLQHEFQALCALLRIPLVSLIHDNKSVRRQDYASYYTSETTEVVAQKHKRDIELFAYSFEGKTAESQLQQPQSL